MARFATGPVAGWSVIVCMAVTVAACRREAQAPVEQESLLVPVGAVPAETSGIRAVVRATGVVSPAEGGEFLAIAPEPARIVEVTKTQGDAVKSGDVLVRFDLPSATAEVARLAADLAAAEAQLENARVNQRRVADFVDRGLVPRRDREIADRELADAQAAVDRSRTLHTKATASAERAIVRAPLDGIVASRLHNPGDVVLSTSADPVLRIVDPRRLDLVATVDEVDVPRVVPGATARVAGPPDGVPIGLKVVRKLADRTGADSHLLFLLAFDDATPSLAVDARVDIDIDAEERANVVLIPVSALIREGNDTVVMIAAGSQAERRQVTTGIQDDERVEITSGVRAGELVITRGHIGLANGAPLSVAIEK
jgi:RND family efflux transporter MFP subunit